MEQEEYIKEKAEESFSKWIFPETCQECGSFLIVKHIDSGKEFWYICEDCGESVELDEFEFDIEELKEKFIDIFKLGYEQQLNSEEVVSIPPNPKGQVPTNASHSEGIGYP